MSQGQSNRSLTVALYLNAAALIAILLVLLGRSNTPAFAQNQLPIGGGAGVFIVPAQFSGTTFGCYLMDIDAQTLMAYQFIPNSTQLKLMAARNFRYDRRLGNYNTLPVPMEIKQYVDQEQQAADRVLQRPTERPPVEAAPRQD
jgi:hypothetical protein